MDSSVFILCSLGLGCTAKRVDDFMEKFDVEYNSEDIYDTMKWLCQTDESDLRNFGNAFIGDLWYRITQRYVEKGLDEDKFDCYLNGDLDTHFYYDGEEVYCEDDLDEYVKQLKLVEA